MAPVLGKLRDLIAGLRAPVEYIAPDPESCIPFKTFGLQRSGTNLARFLVRENFHAVSKERGLEWKHGAIADPERVIDEKLLRTVICVRDPYAWMHSCFRYFNRNRTKAVHADKTVDPTFTAETTFPQFVTSPHYDWPSPAERWNEMTQHWLEHHDGHAGYSTVIRSEDMLSPEDQEEQLARIEADLSLERLRPTFRTSSRVVSVRSSEMRQMMDFDYYRLRRYLAEYDETLLAFVNERLDWSLMDRLHYERADSPPK